MEEIEYTRLPPVGSQGTRTRAALHEFLLEIPGLFHFGYVPPLRVINEFLKEGRADAGMGGGCEWEPFAISAAVYAEVVRSLREAGCRAHGQELHFVEVPDTIERKNEWAAWVFHQEVGIPYREHLDLMDREEDLKRRTREAAERDDEHALELHLEWYSVGMELVRFTEPYLERYRERRDR